MKRSGRCDLCNRESGISPCAPCRLPSATPPRTLQTALQRLSDDVHWFTQHYPQAYELGYDVWAEDKVSNRHQTSVPTEATVFDPRHARTRGDVSIAAVRVFEALAAMTKARKALARALPPEPVVEEMPLRGWCVVCGQEPIFKAGRCRADYDFNRAHDGRDASPREIEARWYRRTQRSA